MSYVCAYSSVQLDKSRVEKEFTKNSGVLRASPRLGLGGLDYITVKSFTIINLVLRLSFNALGSLRNDGR